MKSEELDRRIAALEADLAGQAQTIEERRGANPKEELRGIKVGAKKDLDRFVDDMIRQLPNVIDTAKGRRSEAVFLPAYLEDEFKKWGGDGDERNRGAQLEALAEKTIRRLVRDDAKRIEASAWPTFSARTTSGSDVQVDTLAYDVGVVALPPRRAGS